LVVAAVAVEVTVVTVVEIYVYVYIYNLIINVADLCWVLLMKSKK
jgi:hypothetical protein